MTRLDDALGGTWWRDLVRGGVSGRAVDEIVTGFMSRLARAVKMDMFAIPVRRGPAQKPIYFLVFGTRKPLGIWHFADDAARATETWWDTLDAKDIAKQEASPQPPLFSATSHTRPLLSDVEEEARPQIAENIAALVARHGRIRVGSYPAEVFGGYLGRVRETVVRAAIKDLHAAGRTSTDGKGSPIANLVVSPPH
jgi:hypothetical protein